MNELFFSVKPGLSNQHSRWWLAIAIFFSLVYSTMALHQAFNSEYIVQDDARQHVFWMRRWLDPQLFPKDLIADYFQSVAPLGYKSIYALAAVLGIDPIVLSKLLPSLLGVITTYYCFLLTMELLPIPWTGFLGSLLLNQNLWLQDGLISGTPKAFAIPFLLAFLYYYAKNYLFGISISIFLLGFFYPSFVFICSGLLIVRLWQFKSYLISSNKIRDSRILGCIIGLLVAFVVLLPYAVSTSEFSPTITLEQARNLNDFAVNGRSSFFNENTWDFWFNGSRSGLRISSALMPPLNYLAILLPLLLKFNSKFNLSRQVTPKIQVLKQLLLVSLAMFGIAHLILFTLHLPSRYTQNPLRIIIAIASSISITIIVYSLSQITSNYLVKRQFLKSLLSQLIYFCLGLLLIIYPHSLQNFVWTQYERGNVPELYQFLQKQPKDTLVASLSYEADNLPTFAQRSILVSKEYAIPYHTGYYFPFRQRAIALIQASYSQDLAVVKNFIDQYQIDFWLIDDFSFTPEYLTNNNWIMQHQPVAQNAVQNLEQKQVPALQLVKDKCSVLKTPGLQLIDAYCILSSSFESS